MADTRVPPRRTQEQTLDIISESSNERSILPNTANLERAHSSLVGSLPDKGLGIEWTTNHLWQDIVPALNGQSLSSNYYGFVTGGVTPAARVGENIVSAFDQNAAVHLPDQTVATSVEDSALKLLLDLLNFDIAAWPTRTLTTGRATASNILGLACGREYTVNEAVRRKRQRASRPTGLDIEESNVETVGEHGLLTACQVAGINNVQILTTMPHSSLRKAASVVGLGRSCVREVSLSSQSIAFDLDRLEEELKNPASASIVVISCAEVNTGLFATGSYDDVHAAFGLFARLLDRKPEFHAIHRGTEGLEVADSIAGDSHKLLNVPYDCGFFFSRHSGRLQEVFQNPNASYLNFDGMKRDTVESPLNMGLENSRRFRALPVYATLISYGRHGYREMIERQVMFARKVALFFSQNPHFDLLPELINNSAGIDQYIYIVVLFRAKDDNLNTMLVSSINKTSRAYVSGTTWQGRPACRIAAANWQIEPARDAEKVVRVVEDVLKDWKQNQNIN
ncbi:MAG: hypothetical protein Q9190_004656 [Brigantiaea leucoxantha]